MKQSFFSKPSVKISSFILIFFFFTSLGFLYHKQIPSKWYIKYRIDTNIKIHATSKLVNNIFKDLKLISSSDLLINFVNEKLRSSDTQFIIEKFPDISQPSIDTNSIIFYTSENVYRNILV